MLRVPQRGLFSSCWVRGRVSLVRRVWNWNLSRSLGAFRSRLFCFCRRFGSSVGCAVDREDEGVCEAGGLCAEFLGVETLVRRSLRGLWCPAWCGVVVNFRVGICGSVGDVLAVSGSALGVQYGMRSWVDPGGDRR